jgi:hypothetical protein
MNDRSKGLMPSDDEIRKILDQTMQENPSRYPAVVLQIELARLMVKTIYMFRESLIESTKQLEDTIYGNK